MTATKDQERKALEQIKKIVEDLGPDSYVGTAFEGCFEIAEANIEFDFAGSMKSRWEGEMEKSRALLEKVEKLKDELSESEKDYEALHAAAHEVAEEKDAEIKALKDEIKSVKERSAYHSKQADEAAGEKADLETKLAAAELEIVKLKAKLYDVMVGA